jgi:hypothetical protein
MNVIRHHHRDVQIVLCVVVMAAAGKDNAPVLIGQYSAILGHKRDEVRLVVTLQVRQITTIKAHNCEFENLLFRLARTVITKAGVSGELALARPDEGVRAYVSGGVRAYVVWAG